MVIVIKMTKMVQVSDGIYETLMLYKGGLMAMTKKAVTFDDVIAYEFNKANHLTQIISRLVREFPEERDRVEKIAKELNAYEYIKAIVEFVGKHTKK